MRADEEPGRCHKARVFPPVSPTKPKPTPYFHTLPKSQGSLWLPEQHPRFG